MDSGLFNIILSIFTMVLAAGGAYLVNFLREKIGNEKLVKYYELTKQVVMAIEQSNPQLEGVDKKDLAVNKLLQLTNNGISPEQADVLIESAVYDIKKLLSSIK